MSVTEVGDWRGPGWDNSGGGPGGGGTMQGPGLFGLSDVGAGETGTIQILVGEGEVEGLYNGLKSVYLDGTPIQNADGSMNFKGVAVALVAGTNTQAAVKGITTSESETAVGVQVVHATPVTRTITTNPSAVRVRISIPSMKIVSTVDGNSTGNAVQVRIERQNPSYKPSGGALGDWEIVPIDFNGVISGGPFSTKFTKSYRVDLPMNGSWQIRVSRISADDADAYHQSQTWWEAYTEITDARLRYPNSCVVSVRVNSKQFRTIPKVTLDMKMQKVLVPANYDPATRTYYTTGFGTSGGAWDGTFGDRATSTLNKKVWSDNPAWAFYDAATQARYGAGSFVDATAMDKWSLYSIAQFCDTLVDDGKGGTEPRMAISFYAQNAQNAIKALNQLAAIFYGMIYYGAGLVTPVADLDTSPVGLFTNANVEGGKFAYAGTAKAARHTAAIVAFTNPDLGWTQDMAIYEDTAGIARFGYNPLDLNALGCASQGQALRLGKWAILTELLCSETVGFTTSLEGSTCRPGDVIQVADQFRAGAIRNGGRCAAGSTTTVINLDAPVTLAVGTNTLKIKTTAGVVESRTISTGPGTVSSVTVATPFSEAPAAGQGWLIQAGVTASLYRVVGVRETEGGKYEVTALLHDPSKYTALGLTAGDVLTRPGTTLTCPAPTGLTAAGVTRILDDRRWQVIEAAWTLDSATTYIAEASRDNGPWQPMTVSGPGAVLDNASPGSWVIRVAGVYPGGVSPITSTTITVTQPTTPPTIPGTLANQERLQNGVIYQSLTPWGATTYTYDGATTHTANSGAAKLLASKTQAAVDTADVASGTGDLSQTFNYPTPIPGVTPTLKFWHYRHHTIAGALATITAKAGSTAVYIQRLDNGSAESLVTTVTITAEDTWEQASIDLSSYMAAGGVYGIRLHGAVSTNFTTGPTVGATGTASAWLDDISLKG